MLLKLKRKKGLSRHKKVWLDVHNYHLRHQWRLSGGLFIPHSYTDMNSESLSWWDDVGFIYAKRRVMVNWRHPRMVYTDMIEDAAYGIGEPLSPYKSFGAPRGLYNRFARKRVSLFVCSKKKYKKLGQSRKKYIGCEIAPLTTEERDYHNAKLALRNSLFSTDQGYGISPSIKSEITYWCQRIEMVAPVEVRCEKDLLVLRDIALAYLKGDTTRLMAMPVYTFKDWSTDGSMPEANIPVSHGLK